MPTLTVIRDDEEHTSQSPHISVATPYQNKGVVRFEKQKAWPSELVGEPPQTIKDCELVVTNEDGTYSGVIYNVESMALYFNPST